MDLDDLTPMGGGSLRMPVLGPHRQTVASFTLTRNVDPAEAWQPFTRMSDVTRGGQQGNPYGSFGRGLEHEPVDRAERIAQHTAQTVARDQNDGQGDDRKPAVFSHAETATAIRAALRPGM